MERNIARLTHEAWDEKQTIEFSAESDINEYIDQIERLLVALGFTAETVRDGFIAKADELELEGVDDGEDLHTQ